MVKPDAIQHLGQIVDSIEKAGFQGSLMKMTHFSRNDSDNFYFEHKVKTFFENLIQFMNTGSVVGMELVAENSIKLWRDLLGPTNT